MKDRATAITSFSCNKWHTLSQIMVDSHDEVIPGSMWRAAILISLSSLLFGYALASLNSCLVVGDGNSEIACFNGDDDASPNCPPGSIYDDMKLTTRSYFILDDFWLSFIYRIDSRNSNCHVIDYCRCLDWLFVGFWAIRSIW